VCFVIALFKGLLLLAAVLVLVLLFAKIYPHVIGDMVARLEQMLTV
jgi:hypothetical protein